MPVPTAVLLAIERVTMSSAVCSCHVKMNPTAAGQCKAAVNAWHQSTDSCNLFPQVQGVYLRLHNATAAPPEDALQ